MRKRHRVRVAWLLAVVMTLSPSLAYSQPPAAHGASKSVPGAKVDLGYVTPESVAAVVLHPRRVLTAPEEEMLPTEVITAAGKKTLDIDPLDIEQALLIVEPPSPGRPPQAGIVLRMANRLPEGRVLGPLWAQTEEGQLDGKPYRKPLETAGFGIFRADDRTLVVADEGLLRKMLANHAKPAPGAVSKLLGAMQPVPDATAVLAVEPLRPLAAAALSQAPLPPPLAEAAKLPELVQSVVVRADFTGAMAMSLSVRATDERAAGEVAEIIDHAIAMGKQLIAAQIAMESRSDDSVQQAMAKYSRRISERMLEALRPVRKGDTLVLRTHGQGQTQIAVIGVLVALLLPAVQAAREAARRSQSVNNLKQIGLAMHNYHDVYKTFPPRANFDKSGKPLLSWRVHVLPYIEQQALYREFHLDEPWDSAHNKKLIPRMPALYQNPSAPLRPGMAHYLAVSGKGLMFEGSKGRALAEIANGASNTIMALEVDPARAVPWTKPDDWQFNAAKPLAGLGKAHPGGFNALFADGSVRFISVTVDAKVFRAMLTITGDDATQ